LLFEIGVAIDKKRRKSTGKRPHPLILPLKEASVLYSTFLKRCIIIMFYEKRGLAMVAISLGEGRDEAFFFLLLQPTKQGIEAIIPYNTI
jgi:hypothetical protein